MAAVRVRCPDCGQIDHRAPGEIELYEVRELGRMPFCHVLFRCPSCLRWRTQRVTMAEALKAGLACRSLVVAFEGAPEAPALTPDDLLALRLELKTWL